MTSDLRTTPAVAAPGVADFGPPDFTYLHMDTPSRPMHWAMVLEVGPGEPLTVDALRGRVRERIGLFDVFRTGVRNGRWRRPEVVVAAVADVDVDRHVTEGTVTDRADLYDRIATLCATHLPRPDPFWHITLLTSTDTDDQVVLIRVHHSLSDGLAGAAFAALLADGTPADLAEFERFATSPRFRVGAITDDELAEAKSSYGEQWTAAKGRQGWPSLTRSGRREIALASASTRELRRSARHHGASVHEFLLAAIGRTVSLCPATADNARPEIIRVTLPVTLDPAFRHTGNAVSVSLLNLAGDETDLARQIERCRTELSVIETHRPELALAATDHHRPPPWPVMRAIVGASMSRMSPDIHIGINPGFSRVRSVLGRPILGLTPLSPLAGYSFSVTSLILGDRTTFGVVGDPGALPGYPARFVQQFDQVLADARG